MTDSDRFPNDRIDGENAEGAAEQAYQSVGGEDEGGADDEGDDNGQRQDQKPLSYPSQSADQGQNDPNKVEDLAKAGRDIDTDEGAD